VSQATAPTLSAASWPASAGSSAPNRLSAPAVSPHEPATRYLICGMIHKRAIAPKCVTVTHNLPSDQTGDTRIYKEK
jgi:hypothetical protein